MIKFTDLVQDSGKFQAMITMLEQVMKAPIYPKYLMPTFNETKDWKGIEKVVDRVPMASLIDVHSGKPLIGTTAPAYLRGSLPSWGDTITVTSDELIEIQKLENYILSNVVNGVGSLSQIQIDQLTDQRTQLLLRKFEKLARMPLVSMDKLTLEELSNGTATIDKTKNRAMIPYQIDFGIKKYHVPTVWSDTDNADALADLDAFVYKVRKDMGIVIDTLTLNKDEIRKILSQTKVKSILNTDITIGNRRTKITGNPALEDVNIYIEGRYNLPALTINEDIIDIADSDGNITESFNGFQDGRVSATKGTQFGEYMYTLDPEQRLPDSDYKYATSEGNVLLSVLSKKGELSLESSLTSLPVPTHRKTMAILVTDDTTTGDSIC